SSRVQAQQTDRAKQIGGKFMCICTCNQVLTQCNHVGCTTSASMLKELDGWVARGDSETVITSAFVQEFGTKVYAEPPRSGLSLVAAFAISSTDGAVLGACLALAVATLLFIFYIQPDASDLAPHRSKLDQLMERRDTIYDNLRDLRFEFRSGKYSEGDYNAMKTSLENEAALV